MGEDSGAEDTVRVRLAKLLREGPVDSFSISGTLGLPEAQVSLHLDHIRRSARHWGEVLELVPARCKRCGFEFADRERLTRPGRCPECRGSRITRPRHALVPAD